MTKTEGNLETLLLAYHERYAQGDLKQVAEIIRKLTEYGDPNALMAERDFNPVILETYKDAAASRDYPKMVSLEFQIGKFG